MTGRTGISPGTRGQDRFVGAVTGALGLVLVALGGYAWTAPTSFARFVDFPFHGHFLHDLGVFQLGVGAMLLFALVRRDALTVTLAGFLTTNTLHAVVHVADLDIGGSVRDPLVLGALSLLAVAALVVRLRLLSTSHTTERS